MSPRYSYLLAAALTVAAAGPARAQLAAAAGPADVVATAPLAAPAATPAAAPAPLDLEGTTPATAPAAPASAAAPSLAAAPSALQFTRVAPATLDQEQAAVQARTRGTLQRSQVLMIVGGAALLTGLLIGDDAGTILAVGGAGIGLYGLYLYLQ